MSAGRWVVLLLALSGGLADAAVELHPLFTQAKADDLLTWEIHGVPVEWLQFDCARTPRLVITGPDGAVWQRAAWLGQSFTRKADGWLPAGERVLYARHSPRLAGAHKWVLNDLHDQPLAHGEFTVAAASDHRMAPGPLRLSKDNPRLLANADGSIFIPIGPNIAWANGPDRLANFAKYFAALAAAGGNHVRLWCSSWCCGIEGEKADDYRLDQAWVLDQVLALARTNHLRVTLVLDNHHDFTYAKTFPYGVDYAERVANFLVPTPPAQYERRLRYVLARYGADDTVLAWELFNELDQAYANRPVAAAWVKGAAAMLARLDQDHRLRTVSWAEDDWDVVENAPDIDLAQLHSYVLEYTLADDRFKLATRDGVACLAVGAERANTLSRPFCFGEVGYQGTDQYHPGNDQDEEGLLMLQQAWAGFMLGGYGSGMNWWWDGYVDQRNLWRLYHGMAVIVPRLNWRDRGLAPLQPNDGSLLRVIGWLSQTQALLWPQPRLDTWYRRFSEGRERPVYTKPFAVQIGGLRPNTRFAVHQLDQATGAEGASAMAQSDAAGVLPLNIPAKCLDLVLHVEVAK